MDFGQFAIFVPMEKLPVATVVKHTGSHYLLSHLPEWDPFPAVVRGRIRLRDTSATNPIAVGDKVLYALHDSGDDTLATIEKILPRTNYIIRRSVNLSRQAHIIAANLNRVFLIVTIEFPEVKPAFVDRFLVTCEAYRIKAVLVVNKIDIYDRFALEQMEVFKSIYSGAGYEIMEVSAITGEGIEPIRELCKGKDSDNVSLFSGVSGVGKSSLIRAIDPTLDPKIREISQAHLQGRHTTTFYEMYPLQSGGFIIDTPGIRGFGLVDIEPHELSTYFPEMLKVMDNCKFMPCTHTHEPDCAVKAALEEGVISYERYNSYLGMLEEETKYR